MNKIKRITNFNYKGQYHGFQQWTMNDNHNLNVRTMYKNDKEIGYEECHSIKKTNLYIR